VDSRKFWDVRNTLDVMGDLPRKAPVLDCGAFASLPLLALQGAGFRNLSGIDLNPGVTGLTVLPGVCPSVQDMQHTAFADESFAALVCSSTIEHGASWDDFLAEAARLLQRHGRLYLSTDLVAQDACTDGLEEFGLPWTPLRPSDLAMIGERFTAHGFDAPAPADVGPLDRLPITFLGVAMGLIAFVTQRSADGR
jgi:SAM-dependent methyltransferase